PAHRRFAPAGRQRSSAPLQVLLFLNGWYSATYFLLEAFIFVYKGPVGDTPGAVGDTLLLTACPTGSKGNLCQRKLLLSISLALTIPAAVMAAYYLLLQTYALRLEAILNAILLLFYAVELLLGVLVLVSFARYHCPSTPCGEPAWIRTEMPCHAKAAGTERHGYMRQQGASSPGARPSPYQQAAPACRQPQAGEVSTLPARRFTRRT
ncbi:PREDICTED: transmembrane protein 216-like, partial [Phaethon lepturus]